MSAIDIAFDLLKMPLYHGTNEEAWEKIQQEGLKPTDQAPQLFDFTEGHIREQYSDEDYEKLFGGDWAFAYGDKSAPSRHWAGGKNAGIRNAKEWAGSNHDDVVLEIDDSHPFIDEPPINEGGAYSVGDKPFIFNEGKDQRRTNQTIPAHLIRRVSDEETQAAYDGGEKYYEMMENNTRWMDEMVQQAVRNESPLTDEQFDDLLQMRLRYSKWGNNRLEDFR